MKITIHEIDELRSALPTIYRGHLSLCSNEVVSTGRSCTVLSKDLQYLLSGNLHGYQEFYADTDLFQTILEIIHESKNNRQKN